MGHSVVVAVSWDVMYFSLSSYCNCIVYLNVFYVILFWRNFVHTIDNVRQQCIDDCSFILMTTAHYLACIACVDAVMKASRLLATDAARRQDVRRASYALWHHLQPLSSCWSKHQLKQQTINNINMHNCWLVYVVYRCRMYDSWTAAVPRGREWLRPPSENYAPRHPMKFMIRLINCTCRIGKHNSIVLCPLSWKYGHPTAPSTNCKSQTVAALEYSNIMSILFNQSVIRDQPRKTVTQWSLGP